MKITNSQEANQYYKIVNDLVDQYIQKWKIQPTSLSRYFKPGSPKFESFLINNGLSEVEGIKRIVQDVIEDRTNMQLDGILTFESFKSKINESSLSVGDATIDHEKVLADFYNTSLGHIEPKDKSKHTFEVNDFGDKCICVVYSESELEEIKKKLVDESLDSIKSKKVVADNQVPYIYIDLSDIISEDKFRETYNKALTEEKLIQHISHSVNAKFQKEFKGHFIWKLH